MKKSAVGYVSYVTWWGGTRVDFKNDGPRPKAGDTVYLNWDENKCSHCKWWLKTAYTNEHPLTHCGSCGKEL